ncbi:MAG: hypothetical protein ACI4WW_02695 [Candidatus Coprovivens sp.]
MSEKNGKKVEDLEYTVKWVSRNLRDYGNCYVGKECSDDLLMRLTFDGYNVITTKSESGIILKLLNQEDFKNKEILK